MTKKDLAAKLAQGVRQARQQPAPAGVTEAIGVAEVAPVSTSRSTPYARQADQSPPPSLDRAWDNLHPERIWPD